jgi:hypothetical protein
MSIEQPQIGSRKEIRKPTDKFYNKLKNKKNHNQNQNSPRLLDTSGAHIHSWIPPLCTQVSQCPLADHRQLPVPPIHRQSNARRIRSHCRELVRRIAPQWQPTAPQSPASNPFPSILHRSTIGMLPTGERGLN